jgi:hypothetical protein
MEPNKNYLIEGTNKFKMASPARYGNTLIRRFAAPSTSIEHMSTKKQV